MIRQVQLSIPLRLSQTRQVLLSSSALTTRMQEQISSFRTNSPMARYVLFFWLSACRFTCLYTQIFVRNSLFYDGPSPPSGLFDDFLTILSESNDVHTRKFTDFINSVNTTSVAG